jgi:hypothetical protein
LSQLHLHPRFIKNEISFKSALSTFSTHFYGHLALSAFFVSLLLLFGSCEKKDGNVIDSTGTAPLLTQVSLSPSVINSDTINVGSNRQPTDLLTIATTIVARVQTSSQGTTSVDYSITSSDSLMFLSRGTLLDDGQAPDQSKGDGLYSARASFQIRRVQFGSYTVQVDAESEQGYRSNTIFTPLVIVRGNRPPVISELSAPDTVKLGNQSQSLLLTVRANDPDGLSDIAKVLFNSYKPDGTASGGNPFLMYDDGLAAHGDASAGDGIFSLLISLPSNTQLGTYRFEFQAFDRSSEPSNVIILRLTVKP